MRKECIMNVNESKKNVIVSDKEGEVEICISIEMKSLNNGLIYLYREQEG